MIINKIRRGNKPFFITTYYHYYHALDKQERVLTYTDIDRHIYG